MNIIVTGGSGFIGYHLVKNLLTGNNITVINIDKETYAGKNATLETEGYKHYSICITNESEIDQVIRFVQPEYIYHLAAETHVDRSIENPSDFVKTNVLGTFNLLHAALRYHDTTGKLKKFVHVSTDEIYGSISSSEKSFTEHSRIQPSSPYSASKAASDHLALSYFTTYGLPVVVTNCSNNYGPNQHSEKFIPTVINHLLKQKAVPIYGTGENVRDWLFVADHVEALIKIGKRGIAGERYNIGGNCEQSNLDMVMIIWEIIEKYRYNGGRKKSFPGINYVIDRKGHDWRYAVDFSKLKDELGWSPKTGLKEGLNHTLNYYLDKLNP